MSSRLEQFIRDNREDFDSEEPGKQVWENIQYPGKTIEGKDLPGTNGKLLQLRPFRWSAAAAVILLVAGTLVYVSRTRTTTSTAPTAATASGGQPIAKSQPAAADPGPAAANPAPVTPDAVSPGATKSGAATPDATNSVPQKDPATPATQNPGSLAQTKKPARTSPAPANRSKQPASEALADYQEEMGHYARLVELKHKELKRIEKDEPLLYKQFAGDVNKLDNVYHSLEKELSTNPNREQLLEAMLQNLQLQMELLNHQLKIIRQINHSKKTAYENAYKTT